MDPVDLQCVKQRQRRIAGGEHPFFVTVTVLAGKSCGVARGGKIESLQSTRKI